MFCPYVNSVYLFTYVKENKMKIIIAAVSGVATLGLLWISSDPLSERTLFA